MEETRRHEEGEDQGDGGGGGGAGVVGAGCGENRKRRGKKEWSVSGKLNYSRGMVRT